MYLSRLTRFEISVKNGCRVETVSLTGDLMHGRALCIFERSQGFSQSALSVNYFGSTNYNF